MKIKNVRIVKVTKKGKLQIYVSIGDDKKDKSYIFTVSSEEYLWWRELIGETVMEVE